MRIIPPVRDVLGENLVKLWRMNDQLSRRFPDTEEGVQAFLIFIRLAVDRQLQNERG